MGKSSFNTEIHTEEPLVHSEQEYGMRYPDGATKWKTDGGQIPFRLLVDNEVKLAHWHNILRERAARINVEPEEYIAGHQLLRRTIVLAVTAPEEV